MTGRIIRFNEAIREATQICLARDPRVYVMGLGVPDPKGTFGTTSGLQEEFGSERVFDIPTSENGMTGVAIGTAIVGMRPIMTHQRVDFALLSIEQIVNQAAKWHYMFNGQMRVPLVIRMVIGRGWGQGPQHSQSLQAWFAHVPGLRVVMPTTAHDAKGLLIASVEDDNPVIFLEHRWLHGVSGEVPEGHYTVPLGKARIAREGADITIVSASYMTLEALRAADALAADGIDAEIIDLRCIAPLDSETILRSVKKTRRLVVVDTASRSFGMSGEIVALVSEQLHGVLQAAPARVALPDSPTPTGPTLANLYYPRSPDIVAAVGRMFGRSPAPRATLAPGVFLDTPDPSFTGPF